MKFETPVVEVITFAVEDVINVSGSEPVWTRPDEDDGTPLN